MLEESTTENPTRERLLEVAEGLFAERGFEQVSVRDITQGAGANVAAINYHFGSRNGLVDAVVERFVIPIEEDRLVALGKIEAEGDPSLEEIMGAFLQPLLVRVKESELSEQLFFKLIARCTTQPSDLFPPKLRGLIEQVVQRFTAAVQKALPDLSAQSILWRLHFTWGALSQSLAHQGAFELVTKGRAGPIEPGVMFDELVEFACAGMRA